MQFAIQNVLWENAKTGLGLVSRSSWKNAITRSVSTWVVFWIDVSISELRDSELTCVTEQQSGDSSYLVGLNGPKSWNEVHWDKNSPWMLRGLGSAFGSSCISITHRTQSTLLERIACQRLLQSHKLLPHVTTGLTWCNALFPSPSRKFDTRSINPRAPAATELLGTKSSFEEYRIQHLSAILWMRSSIDRDAPIRMRSNNDGMHTVLPPNFFEVLSLRQ